MKIKKSGIIFCLGLFGLIWTTAGFSAEPFKFQRKIGSQSQSQKQTQGPVIQGQRQGAQTQARGTQTSQQMQVRQGTFYTYRCRVDSLHRGHIAAPFFMQFNRYRDTNEPNAKPVTIPLICDATEPQGRSGWHMSIEFHTWDEAMNFFNFIQNKTLYGYGAPYGTQMEMLEFTSYYIGPQQ